MPLARKRLSLIHIYMCIRDRRKGRDREDKPEYKVKISAALCFSNKINRLEFYHNSSWLEYGGAPEKAAKNAFVYAIDAYLLSLIHISRFCLS